MEKKKKLNDEVTQIIKTIMNTAVADSGKFNSQYDIEYWQAVNFSYRLHEYQLKWSDTAVFCPNAIHFFQYLDTCIEDGLLRNSYHFKELDTLVNTLRFDSLKMHEADLWAHADILLTDAFMHVIADLKQGRLVDDTLSYKNDSNKYAPFFNQNLNTFLKEQQPNTFFKSFQPTMKHYWELKNEVAGFYNKMDTSKYTYLHFPFTSGIIEDSLNFITALTERLNEDTSIKIKLKNNPDSLELAEAIKIYQSKNGMDKDGQYGRKLVSALNLTDAIRLKRLLITLDRYKLLPEQLPNQYIWVNIPSFQLEVWSDDTISMTSRVVCGRPSTPTPIIKSEIYEIVTYPTWTVPSSIIKKELLPGLKRSTAYLSRKGMDLYNYNGERVNPSSIDWSKYSKGIPFQIRQRSGDNNALGVMKFNFKNAHDVYLHDTNQRHLFKNSMRALSHGCIRVENWMDLATFIIKNDSMNAVNKRDTIRFMPDSLSSWIAAKRRDRISVNTKIPIYIYYFSCAAIDNKLVFYSDVYDADKKMIEKYFSN